MCTQSVKGTKTSYLHFERMRGACNAGQSPRLIPSLGFTALQSGFAQCQGRGATGNNQINVSMKTAKPSTSALKMDFWPEIVQIIGSVFF